MFLFTLINNHRKVKDETGDVDKPNKEDDN